jgi:hypothetical protein
MDTPVVQNGRFSRVIRILVIATVAVFVLVVISVIVNNRRLSVTRNTMMPGAEIGVSAPNGVFQKNQSAPSIGAPVPMIGGFERTSDVSSSRGIAVNESVPAQDASVSDALAKKIIKTGDLTLKVESIEKTMDNLRWVAGQFGGDIFSSSVYDVSGNSLNKTGLVTLKVPAEHFDEAMQSIKSAARIVVSETTSGQDVSSDYVDLQARLKNKQEEEQSIAAILTRDTNKISDVLEVTTELARVRGEIEQLQAQIKYLDNQSDMSTITVSFTEDTQIGNTDTKWRPSQEIKDAVNTLILAGQRVVSFLISFTIVLLPILIILLVIFGGILYVVVKKLYQWLNR